MTNLRGRRWGRKRLKNLYVYIHYPYIKNLYVYIMYVCIHIYLYVYIHTYITKGVEVLGWGGIWVEEGQWGDIWNILSNKGVGFFLFLSNRCHFGN